MSIEIRETREHGMLFSPPMARAIHDGRKTQTRRVITERNSEVGSGLYWDKLNFDARMALDLPAFGGEYGILVDNSWADSGGSYLHVPHVDGDTRHRVRCRIEPGDLIWVRETWRTCKSLDHVKPSNLVPGAPIQYECGGTNVGRDKLVDPGKLRPSLFMPRWVARSVRRIVSVRPERLQDITEADARAEGITDGGCCACGQSEPCGCDSPSPSARDSYCNLWDSLNAKRGFDWGSNPWVWRIEFEGVNV